MSDDSNDVNNISQIDPENRDTWEHLIGERSDRIPTQDWDTYCNAKKTENVAPDESDKKDIRFRGFCRCEAGKGTKHHGEGRCRMHGGASLRGVEAPGFKHGIFSDYLEEEEREAAEILKSYDNDEKLQEIIDWRLARLRRAVRVSESDVSTDFWDAYTELVRSVDSIGAEEIRELAGLAQSENSSIRAEIDQIRKLIKDHNAITEGQKINMSPADTWRVGLMKAQQEIDSRKEEDS